MGGVIAVAALAGGSYLLSGGESFIPDVDDLLNRGPATPEFEFQKTSFVVVSTTDTNADDLTKAAEPAAAEVQTVLTDLVQRTFVDPDTWGDYEDVFADTMTEDAAKRAGEQTKVLTLGATANDDYTFMTPERGGITMTILTGSEDSAVEASATITFVGLAEATDGSFTTVTSKGTYLLEKIDGEWRIFSFDVDRREKAAKAPASASAGPSSEASA